MRLTEGLGWSLLLLAAGCIDGSARKSRWQCLGAAAVAPRDEPLVVRLTLLDESSDAPVPGARVTRCLRGDIDCGAPTADLVTGADGVVTLGLVDEYVEIRAPGYRDTLAMGLASFELEARTGPELDMHFDLYAVTSFDAIARAAGVARAPDHADIEVLVRDCAYESAAGAEVALDDSDDATERRYLVNDLPSAAAVETDIDSGSVLFFNVPPGLRSIGAHLARSGESTTGDAVPLSVIARPGWLTQVTAMPIALDLLEVEGE